MDQAGRDINVGFYSLIKLTLFIEKFQSVDNAALSEIEPVYHALLAQLQSGELRKELSDFSADRNIKLSLVLLLQDYFRSNSGSRGSGVLNYYIQCLLRTLTQDDTYSVDEGIARLEATSRRFMNSRVSLGSILKISFYIKFGKTTFLIKRT